MPVPSATRMKSLDGLRGIAALTVLFSHTALLVPVLSSAYDYVDIPPTGSWAWWAAMTPLHAAWAGSEAVYVFFVLSGLVLTLSAMRSDFDWFGYFPRRLLRLYLPVWAAVGLLALSFALIPRSPELQGSSWLARRATGYDWETLRIDLTLVFGSEDFALSPLWSLRWEVWFSLLLPLFTLFAIAARRQWALKLLAIAVLLVIGTEKSWPEVRYLTMFAIGSLLAAHWDSVSSWARSALQRSRVGWIMLIIILLGFTSRWWTIALGSPAFLERWWSLLVLVSAVGAVLLAAHWRPAERFLSSRPALWLGSISFSLYLVHEIVVIGTRYALLDAPGYIIAAIAIPGSLLLAWGFHLLVERPANRLARRAGRASRNQLEKLTPSPASTPSAS